MRLLLGVVAGLVLVPTATAGPGLVFTADAGEALHGSVRAGDTAEPYAVDATTRNSTGISYRTRIPPTDAGRWISVGTPRDGTAPFTIRVPADAAGGQYFAGIVAERRVVAV